MYHSFRSCAVSPQDHARVHQRYDEGYVFTRRGKSVMFQVRSIRVRLMAFELSSENRRIMGKHESLQLSRLPRIQFPYHWSIAKLAKDFYARFGTGTFSANKMRQLFTDPSAAFNTVLAYRVDARPIGYCLAFETPDIIHYAYPFYRIAHTDSSPGMAMMTKAVVWAQKEGKQFIYLGSVQDEKSMYKFQFKGVEWFDGIQWRKDKPVF